MTKRQRQRAEKRLKEFHAQVKFLNSWPRRFMDKDGKDVVIVGDPRYETAPYQEIIFPPPQRSEK